VRSLLITAGGSGDAIAAVLLAPLLGIHATPAVLSWSWDRPIGDRLPGPRSAADFDGLRVLEAGVLEVLASSKPRSPAGSSLPRLAAELPARFLLLDPTRGAVGMTRQIVAAARLVEAEQLVLVDVGGDVLARGGEPNLRSPLADLITLGACTATGLPCTLAVAGPGVDGEIDAADLQDRLRTLGARQLVVPDDTAATAAARPFAWHPSEATGVFLAAVRGIRGRVELRHPGRVILDESTAAAYLTDASAVLPDSPAAELADTETLHEAAETLRTRIGVGELHDQPALAAGNRSHGCDRPDRVELTTIDTAAREAAARGSEYLTVRRLAELVDVRSTQGLAELRAALSRHRTAQDRAPLPLYRTRLSG
jgi:hypothetical protein